MSKPSIELIAPGAVLGILGGGQLGRLFVGAAHRLGYRVWVLDPDPDSPAGSIADRHLMGAFDGEAALSELAQGCAAVSYEFENVPSAVVEFLQSQLPVRPGARPLALTQSRLAEKQQAQVCAPEIPPVPYIGVTDVVQIGEAFARLEGPCILKTDRMGYDGKGQAIVTQVAEAEQAFRDFGEVACVLEKKLALVQEVSVLVVRGQGCCVTYPPIENTHVHGILHQSSAPATVETRWWKLIEASSQIQAEAMDYCGVLAIEYFITEQGAYFNEMAPRPHNSGHHTIDSCVSSQFEQQVRTLCGEAPADPVQQRPAVMINLLGDLWQQGEPDWSALQQDPCARLHLYGKRKAQAGRKMGHFCILEDDLEVARERAQAHYRRLSR